MKDKCRWKCDEGCCEKGGRKGVFVLFFSSDSILSQEKASILEFLHIQFQNEKMPFRAVNKSHFDRKADLFWIERRKWMSKKSHFEARKSILFIGKMSKGHADIYIFFLSLLCSWTKICQSQQSIICWWKSVLTKNFPTTFTSRAQTFPLLIPIWIWQGVGVRMERGCAAGYPSGMSHPVKEPSAARSNLLPECLDLGSLCLARWN